MDLIISVEFHKNDSIEVDTFSKFLSEEYDSKDLIFYAYNRSIIEKNLGISFFQPNIEDAKKNNKVFVVCEKAGENQVANIFIKLMDAIEIANEFFNSEQNHDLYAELIDKAVEAIKGVNYINTHILLSLMLKEFKKSRTLVKSKDTINLISLNEIIFQELEKYYFRPNINRKINETIRRTSKLSPEDEEKIKIEVITTFKTHVQEMMEVLTNSNKQQIKEFFEIKGNKKSDLRCLKYINKAVKLIKENINFQDKHKQIAEFIINVFLE